MAEELDLDLDPKNVLASLQQIGKATNDLAAMVEQSLGKDAANSFDKLEKKAITGSEKLGIIFRDLKSRIKDDLKTAFDVGMVVEGAKFAKDLADGTRQVFEMERAFDRLNTRIQLGGKELMSFKRQLGARVAGNGQKLEEILPGVETASARGGVTKPDDLISIADYLSQAKAITGEDSSGLSEAIVEVLKAQGQRVTSQSFKSTLDAAMGTRTAGAFHSATEAAQAMEQLAPYAKQLGLNTRQMGGLSAAASGAGSAGQDILRQLVERGTTIGGREVLNAAFGTQLFKNGKLDPGSFQNIKKDQFGQYSKQVMGDISGITGANGEDLSRFIDAMKAGSNQMKKVADGADEVAKQFETATDNMAFKIDRFKEEVKKGSRDLGDAIANFVKGAMHGNFGGLKDIGKSIGSNAGHLAAAIGITAGVGMLTGGSLKRLMSKLKGKSGLAEGLAEGAAAQALGVQPVYVVNFSEFERSAGFGLFDKLGNGASMGRAGKIGSGIVGLGTGMAIGNELSQTAVGEKVGDSIASIIAPIFTASRKNQGEYNLERSEKKFQSSLENMTPEQLKNAIAAGFVDANGRIVKPTRYTNPSSVKGTGAHI